MAEPREVLDLLDRGVVAALTSLLAPRLQGWDAESWIRGQWITGLDALLGSRRWVVSETVVSSTLTRFHLEGERGTAVATIILDDAGRWFGASLKRRAAEGITNIVLQCPWNEDRAAMSALYGDLLHLDRWDVPQLVFDEGQPNDPRPRWPDPAYPQQMHLDIRVGDLDAVDALVVRGATHLADFDDHRVYADVVGHPFCLYPADVQDPELWRLVIDAPDPDALQKFYERLLGTNTAPVLAFQHSNAEPPRWPDPAYPAQVHFDLVFDDPAPVAARVTELGGSILRQREGFPVYADPAGHPFCIGRPGE
ncbi:MAG TPA: VOC family protein [Acidimicrobiales bacterium]|nr:VOC family protein [Acidimicrobiales bacterium]